MKQSPKPLVMEAIDTNILVRLATRDDERQFQKVEKFLRESFSSQEPAWVSVIVITELAWVLERRYRYTRAQVAAFITGLINTPSFHLEDPSATSKAAELFSSSKADFGDCLILSRNLTRKITPTHTLNRQAAKLQGFKLL